MGIPEWVAIATLGLLLLGHVIKVYSDHRTLANEVEVIGKWKDKMSDLDLLTHAEHTRIRYDCRTELYKDINKLESRFESVLKTIEMSELERRKREDELRSEIRGMRDSVVRVITILENKEN